MGVLLSFLIFTLVKAIFFFFKLLMISVGRLLKDELMLYNILFVCYTIIEIYLYYKYSKLVGIKNVTPHIDKKY